METFFLLFFTGTSQEWEMYDESGFSPPSDNDDEEEEQGTILDKPDFK